VSALPCHLDLNHGDGGLGPVVDRAPDTEFLSRPEPAASDFLVLACVFAYLCSCIALGQEKN
jgi:hypothetical protein